MKSHSFERTINGRIYNFQKMRYGYNMAVSDEAKKRYTFIMRWNAQGKMWLVEAQAGLPGFIFKDELNIHDAIEEKQ